MSVSICYDAANLQFFFELCNFHVVFFETISILALIQAADFSVSIGDDPKKKYDYQKAERWRDYAYLSGLVAIDIDHCGNPHELFVCIQQEHDFKALGILLVYVSASEDGMKHEVTLCSAKNFFRRIFSFFSRQGLTSCENKESK